MALTPSQAVRLARALGDLRESTWPNRDLTQVQLAKALSSEGRVAAATLSACKVTAFAKRRSRALRVGEPRCTALNSGDTAVLCCYWLAPRSFGTDCRSGRPTWSG
jgi:hypothetical protein